MFTIIGLPFAISRLVRWIFISEAVVLENAYVCGISDKHARCFGLLVAYSAFDIGAGHSWAGQSGNSLRANFTAACYTRDCSGVSHLHCAHPVRGSRKHVLLPLAATEGVRVTRGEGCLRY